MFYSKEYDWKNGTVSILPKAERIFKVGDRVKCYHGKSQRTFVGTVVSVDRQRYARQRFRLHPEVYMRTDELVDETPGALFGGFGLRGENSLFTFEDETDKMRDTYDSWGIVEIPQEELEKFRSLKPSLRKKLIMERCSMKWLEFLPLEEL